MSANNSLPRVLRPYNNDLISEDHNTPHIHSLPHIHHNELPHDQKHDIVVHQWFKHFFAGQVLFCYHSMLFVHVHYLVFTEIY